MDQLWAPWRGAYVTQLKKPQEDDPCFICRALASNQDRENVVLVRAPHSVVMLNRYPYNNGHLLVSPRTHKGHLEELTDEELLEAQKTLTKMVALLKKTLRPEGFNIGLNLGRTAGAGLPGHLHWHIVPRWNGDTNFMSALADARVLSMSLDSLYDCLLQNLETSSPTAS